MDNQDPLQPTLVEQIQGMLDNWDTSFSSVCNMIDNEFDVGLMIIKEAISKRERALLNIKDVNQKLIDANSFLNSCETAIKHASNHLKIKFPISMIMDNASVVIHAPDKIEFYPILDVPITTENAN